MNTADQAGAGNGKCQAAIPASGHARGWDECGAPAVATYSYACVHGHIVTRDTCAEHEPVEGDVGCRQCWDAGHDCPMAFQPVG